MLNGANKGGFNKNEINILNDIINKKEQQLQQSNFRS